MPPRRTGVRGESTTDVPKEGRKEEISSPPSNQNGETVHTADLDEALLTVGVYVLSRPRRRALAAELAREGWCAGDVVALDRYLRASMDDAAKVQRTVAAKLIEAEERPAVLADFRKHSHQRSLERVITPAELAERTREQLRRIDAEYEAELRAKAAGTAKPIPHSDHPLWRR